jgi:integrase
VTIRRSKTDQEASGRQIGIPYGSNPATCPVRNLRAWLELAGITDGPLFRPVDRHGTISVSRLSPAGANRIVHRAVRRTGVDPRPYSAHSLRAGLATAAAEASVAERAIMNQTRQRSLVVARSYIRRGSLFRNNAAAQVGL